jgi:hypothetical protein
MNADNQQERLDSYIAGYVDGEGSFHVAVQKVDHTRFGYQLVPEFHVSQNLDYARTLTIIRSRFGCGYIKPNHKKSKTDKSWVFVVRNRNDLLKRVIPFFTQNKLISPKSKDFKKFALIVISMEKKLHFTKAGFIKLLRIAFSMNRKGQYRKQSVAKVIMNLESSTTIR